MFVPPFLRLQNNDGFRRLFTFSLVDLAQWIRNGPDDDILEVYFIMLTFIEHHISLF